MKTILLSILLLTSVLARAQNNDVPSNEIKSPWSDDTELSVVTSSGGATSSTYEGQQKTTYQFGASTLTLGGYYFQNKSSQLDTTTGNVNSTSSTKWNAGLRYDYNFTKDVGAFVGQSSESDTSAGYVQRDNSDLGGKYSLIKTATENLQTELGYRYTKTYNGISNDYINFLRGYVEWAQAIRKGVSYKIWVEYLPNLKNSDAYLANTEASLTSILSSVFSLKVAYLVKYQNVVPFPGEDRAEGLFTTGLVAKF